MLMNPPAFCPVSCPVKIAGTGHVLPGRRIASASFDHDLGLPSGQLEARTGVRSRPVCTTESQIDMAVQASLLALKAAGLDVADIDLVLGACAVPYQPIPATAPLVMRRLGMAGGQAAGFDVNATCLSFLAAFDIAAAKLALGQCKAVLIFSSEVASRALPWQDQPEVAALFGDGAAAVVLTAADAAGPCIRASLMTTYPEAVDACEIGSGGTRFDFHAEPAEFARHSRFRMDGKALFRLTHRHFPDFVGRLLAAAGWDVAEVDLVVPHQASPQALQHMIARTGFVAGQVVDIAASYGNQIAASIPTALDVAWRDGRIGRGSRVVLVGTSAGVSFGGLALVL